MEDRLEKGEQDNRGLTLNIVGSSSQMMFAGMISVE